MNREEAYNIDILTSTGFNSKILVDKIYDDLESRTCENCKHSSIAEDTWSGKVVSMFCDLGIGEWETCDVMMTSPSFGCNKWEKVNNE